MEKTIIEILKDLFEPRELTLTEREYIYDLQKKLHQKDKMMDLIVKMLEGSIIGIDECNFNRTKKLLIDGFDGVIDEITLENHFDYRFGILLEGSRYIYCYTPFFVKVDGEGDFNNTVICYIFNNITPDNFLPNGELKTNDIINKINNLSFTDMIKSLTKR